MLLNKKLFTNFGRISSSTVPSGSGAGGRRRAPTTSGAVRTIYGQNALNRNAQPKSAAVKKSTATTNDAALAERKKCPANERAKSVSWCHYVNLLNLVDGLKHQLPNFGYDLYVPFVARLLFDSVETASTFEHLYDRLASGSASLSSFASSSSLPSSGCNVSAPQISVAECDVTLADVPWHSNLINRDWSHLHKTTLLPILKLLCLGYRDDFRPNNKAFATQTFVPNRAAKRWDNLLTQTALTDATRGGRANNVGSNDDSLGSSFTAIAEDYEEADDDNDNDDDDHRHTEMFGARARPGVAGSGTVAERAATLTKFFAELRTVAIEGAESDHLLTTLSPSAGLSVDALTSRCPCCLLSPLVLLRAGRALDDEVLIDSLAKSYAGHMITFDASAIACGTMPPDRFAENFRLRHILHKASDRLSGELAKTLYVSSMTFFERLTAVEFCVSVLVDWCWSRHRLSHMMLQGAGCSFDGLPPVVVAVHRKLYNILTRVPSVALLSLARQQKFVYHVLN